MHDDLVEIDGLVETAEPFDVLRRRRELQRGTQVQLAQADARIVNAGERIGGFFELDGEMAAVVVHADAPEEGRVAAVTVEIEPEKLQGLAAGLEQAERLRFQAEVQVVARGLAEPLDVLAARFQVVENGVEFIGPDAEFLVRAGQGADAAAHAGRQQSGEDVEEQVGVVEPLARRPVGPEDLFLHPCSVEGAVGESVDGKDVAVVFLEPALEGRKRAGLRQFPRRNRAEPEADSVGSSRGDPLPHAQGVFAQPAPCLLPAFAAVDVGAVAEMETVMELHRFRVYRKKRRIAVNNSTECFGVSLRGFAAACSGGSGWIEGRMSECRLKLCLTPGPPSHHATVQGRGVGRCRSRKDHEASRVGFACP